LTTAVTSLVDLSPRRRRIAVAVVTGALVAGALAACRDGGGSGAEVSQDRGPNAAPPQTLAGGVELASVDPHRLLVGAGLGYGEPLPSQQAAADAYLEDPEVASVVARRLYSRGDGRLLGEVLVLSLDGRELFDEAVLDAFVTGAVAAQGGGEVTAETIGGREVLRSRGSSGTAFGYLEGDQLILLRGSDDHDMRVVVDRQLRAFAAGEAGQADPFTPLLPSPIGSAFVPVPTITFQPVPGADEEPVPEPPGLPGATAVEGRYGVVAGERRTTIWAYALDLGTYPSAESLTPALTTTVSTRAGGAPVEVVEVLGRVVLAADGPEGSPSVRAFRHGGIAVIVQGLDPGQLDAVITAWLTALR
jgi:hypothetical protein